MQNHHFLGFYHIFLLSLFSKSEIYCKWHLQIHAGPDNFWHETHKTPSREANHKFKFHKKAIHRALASKTPYSSLLASTHTLMQLYKYLGEKVLWLM